LFFGGAPEQAAGPSGREEAAPCPPAGGRPAFLAPAAQDSPPEGQTHNFFKKRLDSIINIDIIKIIDAL
jgi:hypothetical protein